MKSVLRAIIVEITSYLDLKSLKIKKVSEDWGFDDVEYQEEHETLSITLNALMGTTGISSIRLIGKINGKEVSFLLDSEATLNFIDPLTAKRIGLQLKEIDNYKVEVADGDSIEGRPYSNGVKIIIQGIITTTDILVLPLVEIPR